MELKGKGSVRQLNKDKARARCRKWRLYQRTGDGRQHTRRFSGTYREALAALDAFRSGLAESVPNSETFAAYASRWCDWRRASGAYRPNTLGNGEMAVRKLCASGIGKMRMDAITPDDCRAALSEVRENQQTGRILSGTTMNRIYTYLNMIMRQAVIDGDIARNPMDGVIPPKKDTGERSWMELGEFRALIERVHGMPPDAHAMAVLLMCRLGLRRGEACALADADVDTVNAVAHIHESISDWRGTIGEPKTPAGVRDLPMPAELCNEVERWRAVRRERGYGDAPTLCCNIYGETMTPRAIQRWWNSHRDALGASGYTLHQLRHSNLSMMARCMSPFDLQRWAGWSSISPAKVYVHEDMDSLRAAVARSQLRLESIDGTRFVAISLPPEQSSGNS